MLLALLSPLLGAMVNLLPSIVGLFEKAQDYKHEVELTKLKMDAAVQAAQLNIDLEEAKADAGEGESLRRHDMSLDGGKFINALRASIRPVITYVFFILFVAIKVSAAWVMIKTGADIPTMLQAVWDQETVALFGAITGFWFGSRTIERLSGNMVNRRMGFQVNATSRSLPKKK
jgi:hypothetical protein